MLKTHVDVLEDFADDIAVKLTVLAEKHNFLLFEDSKFVDIGETVRRQYLRRAAWAHMVTAAPVLAGDGLIKGLKEGAKDLSDKGVSRVVNTIGFLEYCLMTWR